jgi:hypothetical protein
LTLDSESEPNVVTYEHPTITWAAMSTLDWQQADRLGNLHRWQPLVLGRLAWTAISLLCLALWVVPLELSRRLGGDKARKFHPKTAIELHTHRGGSAYRASADLFACEVDGVLGALLGQASEADHSPPLELQSWRMNNSSP